MATKLAAPADPVSQIMNLLGGLGGTTETRTVSPGNTDPLMQVIAQLQGFDPQAQLATIFQQAAGQIPGLQAAYGNAIGARRRGNSAIQNALNQLLVQATVAGQQQVANQQLQAMQIQASAAGGVADATKGTKQTASATPNIGNAAKNMLILQGLAKLADTPAGKQLFGNVLGTAPATAAVATQPVAPAPAAMQAPLTSAAPQMSQATQQGFNVMDILNGAQPDIAADLPTDYGMSMAAPDMMPEFNFNINDFLDTGPAPEMSYAPADWFDQPDVMSYF